MRIWACLLMGLLLTCNRGSGASNMADVSADQFPVISKGTVVDLESRAEAGKITVFDFYADWCPPCKHLDKSLADMKMVYGERMTVFKLDLVNWDSELAKHHGIRDLPYLIVYDDQQKLVEQGPSNQVLPEVVAMLNR